MQKYILFISFHFFKAALHLPQEPAQMENPPKQQQHLEELLAQQDQAFSFQSIAVAF